eukprot:TRINITY_DN2838_c0_g1_i5.p1 TRINITY_DN2838_c0_g1~~TRINITY_DN2838_c0_g1_i5.p1  ORF type:complete len:521 (-),score=90.08 TRINITY_DN2838_c0_g1_i5:277-1839(-)
MLIVEKLQPNTEDVRTEPGALRSSNYSTNIAQNNSSLGDDLEWFAKARELRILVPTKDAFREFVKVDQDPKGNEMTVTGYSVDVFKEVMDSLPYRVSYEFFPYKKDHMVYYDELIQQLHLNTYDGVVGDITITSNRSKYGDFTLPYMTSGVSMIVPIVDTYKKSLWWFLEPLSLKLWLVIISLFLSKGLLVWIFEHENNPEFEGTFSEQMGKILSFSPSIFVFAQKEKLKSNYSRLLVIFWIFGVFVLVTSYTANLKSMITSDNDRPKVLGIEQLMLNGDYVGYQKGSFVFHLLKHMGFQEEKLKAYSSNEEYAIALSRGSCNKGVSAIIEEIPYIKVFLTKYGDRFTMAGPTFGPGGFGFLFRRGCTIVPDISRAVQKFIEGEKMLELEKKWFAFHNQIPQRDMRLSIGGFLGILLITEPISLVALLIFIILTTCKFWKSKRSPSCNRAVEASYIEYFFKRVFIETMNGNHADEGSHIVKGECDLATPNGIPLKVVVMENDCCHVEIDVQNKFVTCDEI